jgi:hypothetical protein
LHWCGLSRRVKKSTSRNKQYERTCEARQAKRLCDKISSTETWYVWYVDYQQLSPNVWRHTGQSMEDIAEAHLEYCLLHCVHIEARQSVYQELQQRYIRRIALANAERDTERTERIMADRCKAKAIAERDSQKAIALREKYRADGERARADRERDRADENARALRHLRYSHCLTHLQQSLLQILDDLTYWRCPCRVTPALPIPVRPNSQQI